MMDKIELISEGIFCIKCGSRMKPFGKKNLKQFRCLENDEHYSTDNKIKTIRKVILE
jgi:DNA-directed RNA polymerase subunit M/transcription elongation factor TFIIS